MRNLSFIQKTTWTKRNPLSQSHILPSRNLKSALAIYAANKINRNLKPFLFEEPGLKYDSDGRDIYVPQIYRVIIPSPVFFSQTVTKEGLQLIFTSERGDISILIPVKFQPILRNRTVNLGPIDFQFHAALRTLIGALYRAMLGVTKGYQEKLKTVGVGYKGRFEENRLLKMALGYSHPVHYLIHRTVDVKLSRKNNRFNLQGPNPLIVNQAAADLYAFKKPDVYNGKGLRYRGYKLVKKEGKKKK
jgi:large subunit ribosomal protein L6